MSAAVLRDLREANRREHDRQRIGGLVAAYLAPDATPRPGIETAIACDGAVASEAHPSGPSSIPDQAAATAQGHARGGRLNPPGAGTTGRVPHRTHPPARIFAHVLVTAAGCWEFQGLRNAEGYGWTRYEGHRERAHRVAFILTHGPIPVGAMVLHRCDNPPCINPVHLWLGDALANVLDARIKGRRYSPTQCPQGHPYAGRNLIPRPQRNGAVHRRCRTCKRAADARQRAATRATSRPLSSARAGSRRPALAPSGS